MIRLLGEDLVNKIAAGEVIIRPASVVKELVENSIDAGATRIAVEVANGCRDVRVTDNGSGIEREDAALALIRHATSKIAEFGDLWQLSTRGFRGEALASIAAVSRMQILTRRPGDIAGTRVVSEGPGEPRIEPAGAPEGTEVRVRDLFFNTPARLKFMKSAASELQQILGVITRQALIRPDISFAVSNEKASLLDLPRTENWAERVGALLGSQAAENLLDVSGERHDVRIRGFVVKPIASRKDRRHQFFSVNARPITSRTLGFVLQEAYKGIIMVQRFPAAVLDITLASGEVDVNVHPTKEEVRFRNESHVGGALHRIVTDRLRAANLMPQISLGNEAESGASATSVPGMAPAVPQSAMQPSMFSAYPVESSGGGLSALGPIAGDFGMFTPSVHPPEISADAADALARQVTMMTAAQREFENESSQTSPAGESNDNGNGASETCSVRPLAHSLRKVAETSSEPDAQSQLLQDGVFPEPLGQISQCYIVAQAGPNLLLIDQHAAHERLLYLELASARKQRASQPLLIPVSVDVPPPAIPYIEKLLPVLNELGLQASHFGGQTFLVDAVPADLPRLDPASILSDLLDDFEFLEKVDQIEILRDRVVTRMACRSAIKAGQQMHLEEMRRLIRNIISARLGFTCPHGRPTMLLLTRDQLDRQFKRRV